MLPVRLCDSTLTLVVPSGPLMVADKHNWSREVTYGPLDCSWSHEISSRGLGRSQQSLLDCWAIAGFHGEPWAIAGLLLGTWAIAGLLLGTWAIAGLLLGTWAIAELLLGTWAIAESLLDCCLVTPFAPWSPPMLCGRPLCSVVAPFEVWSPPLLSGHHLCYLVTTYAIWSPLMQCGAPYAASLPEEHS